VSLLWSASGSAGQAGARDKARSAGRSKAGEWLRYDLILTKWLNRVSENDSDIC
jgi:hypothetical protein